MILRQNLQIGICNGAAMVQPWKKPLGKAKALEFEKKVLRDTLTRAALCELLSTTAN